MLYPIYSSLSTALLLLSLSGVVTADLGKLPQAIYTRSRRFLNFGSLFGSATKSPSPYDRIAGHPVFAVTTAWGSPYMNMEKLNDLNEVVPPESITSSRGEEDQAVIDDANEYRTVVLYFMDQDDALAVHGEMKQMDNMAKADLRLTCFSLAKALRQAANLGHGLPTGAPPDALTGDLKTPQEGGSLRYKIVPAKRQLYYAARCLGKERVGLFSENPADDAQTAVFGNAAIESQNLVRRREKRERKTSQKMTPMQIANIHMDGYTGIPVFYAPEMKRVSPLIKQILSGSKQEVPLFLNYEDMVDAWEKLRERNPKKSIPLKPANVEVFNMWDVLSSMDRENLKKERQTSILKKLLQPIKNRIPSKDDALELEHVTFVPSSRCAKYKEAITARGNGKARLRPMR
mmetsp:Transcript_12317/g.16140  ORF Transcript_12317/g.16140 Transcript_12317/m.16140 type:complete len:403 (+) Transcript_12317:213-1421(+)|eukprot:CAMPEP_0198147066 /NCGR_PEP_ID=MMETSP1443-20131203/33186_1 /TAXON_ID=186043 /ORGANISM="Entomoneis sp., Strain CCMP2396" /LENGTH=402 /DNA_ID=CAMNT_0043811221 /DNA_START=192 /DNA_END=1400 /DNA_ORIENTATION=-